MPLSKEQMREYQKERRAKLAALKADPSMKVIESGSPALPEPVATVETPNGDRMLRDAISAFGGQIVDLRDRVDTIEHAVVDLQARVSDVERQLSPEELTRREAMKPGGRPNALYGA
jgi:hypothetical protein